MLSALHLPALSPTLPLSNAESSLLCDRNYGIGGDGVIFACTSPDKSLYDYEMRIHNSDGTEPEMCGNGVRVFAKYLHLLASTKALREGVPAPSLPVTYRLKTGAGLIVPVVNADGTVTVDMGKPIFKPADVPTTLPNNYDGEGGGVVLKEVDFGAQFGKFKVSCVSMGNPHCIIFVPDLSSIDVSVLGPRIERDLNLFPRKTNVEFVQVLSPQHLKMKVWERGAGTTLACGTGACALTVAAIRAGVIPKPMDGKGVKVSLPGGDLVIEWGRGQTDKNIYMTGGGDYVFEGTVVPGAGKKKTQ